MALTNSNISYTGLVEKYVGTAYDKMAIISDNIDALLHISTAITDGTFDDILEIADDIVDVVQDIEGFNGLYWGGIDTSDPDVILDPTAPPDEPHPLYDKNGDTANQGDLYFNTDRDQMYVYSHADDSSGVWVGTGVVDRTLERWVITEGQAADQANGQPVQIGLANPYTVQSNNLFVFKDGVLMSSTWTEPVTGDYIETSPNIITFQGPNGTNGLTGLQEGEELTFGVNTEVSTSHHIVEVELFDLPAQGSNKVFSLPPGEYYVPGQNNLDVYVGTQRVLQIPDLLDDDWIVTEQNEYTEINTHQIQFHTAPTDQPVLIKRGRVISNTPLAHATIFQDAMPDLEGYIQGQQWWDTGKGRMFVLYVDQDSRQWVSIAGEETVIIDDTPLIPVVPDPIQIRETFMQPDAPDPTLYSKGAQWLKTDTMELFMLYDDAWVGDGGDTSGETPGSDPHWVKVST